jgi:deoxycytidine triphosphate deaminase
MYESGRYVAEHVTPTTEAQVQPNGVDLTLDAVFEQTSPGAVRRDGKTIGERRELDADGDPPAYTLSPGGYVVRYAEEIHIPEDHVGFLYPRSSLLRNSCMVDTAVWDAGYEGRGEGLLEVYREVTIERGARVAQLVLADADHADTYDGSYQGENL